MSTCDVAIIGGGMAGFGAAHHLSQAGHRARLYEKREHHGGHTSTHFYNDGFVFDEGPHISFTQDERIQDLFSKSVGGEFERFRAYVNNYWKGHWIKHPAQVNLHGLPSDVIVRCISDFVEAAKMQEPKIENYEDWLRAAFGNTFAETFPMEYTKKYHTTEARHLATDWIGPRLYRPKLEEVLLGALMPEPLDVHYVDHFRYPTHGGFVAYLNHFLPMAEVLTRHEVVAIEPRKRLMRFSNGGEVCYESLISSVPLPELIPLISGAPSDVRAAASLLSCSQVVLVNIGLNRRVETKAQWTYFYDQEIPFARLSYPSTFSSRLVPSGCGSIQAEIYFSKKWRPLRGAPESFIEPTIEGLLACGLLSSREEVIHRSVIFAPYANIIFDHDRTPALATVHGYLDDVGIGYCGRYGDWGYIWTDQAFRSGERAAEKQLVRVKALAAKSE